MSRSLTVAVEPIIIVGLSWLLLTAGAQYPVTQRGRVRWTRLLGGVVWGAVSAGAIGGAVYYSLPYIEPELVRGRVVLALALAAASGETTQHVMQWVRERYGANGPLLDWLEDLTVAEDIVPIGLIAALSAMGGGARIAPVIGPLGVAGTTAALGILLGLLCAMLLGREFRLRESWGTLIGMSLIAVGVSAQVGLSYLVVLWVLGVTLVAASRHAAEVRAMVGPTERGALLPVLIVCGISLDVDPHDMRRMAMVFGVVLGARVLIRLLLGRLLAATLPFASRAGGARLGLGLLSSGSLTMCVGLATALAFPGTTGETVLVVSAALCVAGELAGPPALRSALRRAGEIRADGAEPAVHSNHPQSA